MSTFKTSSRRLVSDFVEMRQLLIGCDLIFSGIEDDVTRRDSLHAIVNSLPDPNYATLRALTLVGVTPNKLCSTLMC